MLLGLAMRGRLSRSRPGWGFQVGTGQVRAVRTAQPWKFILELMFDISGRGLTIPAGFGSEQLGLEVFRGHLCNLKNWQSRASDIRALSKRRSHVLGHGEHLIEAHLTPANGRCTAGT